MNTLTSWEKFVREVVKQGPGIAAVTGAPPNTVMCLLLATARMEGGWGTYAGVGDWSAITQAERDRLALALERRTAEDRDLVVERIGLYPKRGAFSWFQYNCWPQPADAGWQPWGAHLVQQGWTIWDLVDEAKIVAFWGVKLANMWLRLAGHAERELETIYRMELPSVRYSVAKFEHAWDNAERTLEAYIPAEASEEKDPERPDPAPATEVTSPMVEQVAQQLGLEKAAVADAVDRAMKGELPLLPLPKPQRSPRQRAQHAAGGKGAAVVAGGGITVGVIVVVSKLASGEPLGPEDHAIISAAATAVAAWAAGFMHTLGKNG